MDDAPTPPPEVIPIQEPRGESEIRRGIIHEVKLALAGALFINAISINKQFSSEPSPIIHIHMLFFTFQVLCVLDDEEYPPPQPIYIFAIRGCTNFVLFILGLVVTKVGSFFEPQEYVLKGLVSFVMEWMAISSMIGLVRGMLLVTIIIVKKIRNRNRTPTTFGNNRNENAE